MIRTSLLRKVGALAVTAIAGIGAIAGTSSPASAWTGSGSGSRGSISMPTIYVGDLLMPNGHTEFTMYGNSGVVAYRIAGTTGVQTIRAVYYLQKWNGSSWVVIKQSPLLSGTMNAAQTSVNFTRPYLQPGVARGYFRITTAVDWLNSAGTLLGATFVSSNSTSDHVCVTPLRLCSSAAGFVQTGLDRWTW